MKIVWSPLAIERVSAIAKYIAENNPQSATQWVNDLFSKVEPLADFPNMGHITPEFENPNIRELVFGKYRIIYRIDDAIFVLTVRHSSQLLQANDMEESIG